MTVIVAGTFRLPPENLTAFKPHMEAMLAASRAEEGCVEYAYAFDVEDPGLIRVYEAWRDDAALEAHFQTEHIAAWRAAWPAFGASERRLKLYRVESEQPL